MAQISSFSDLSPVKKRATRRVDSFITGRDLGPRIQKVSYGAAEI